MTCGLSIYPRLYCTFTHHDNLGRSATLGRLRKSGSSKGLLVSPLGLQFFVCTILCSRSHSSCIIAYLLHLLELSHEPVARRPSSCLHGQLRSCLLASLSFTPHSIWPFTLYWTAFEFRIGCADRFIGMGVVGNLKHASCVRQGTTIALVSHAFSIYS